MMEFRYAHGDDTHTIVLEQQPDGSFTALIGGQTYHVTLLDDGILRIDGRGVRVRTAHRDSARLVNLLGTGHTFTLERLTRRSQKRAAAGAQGALNAQMPGQIMAVQVAAGDQVEAGQTLLIMEAMKMEMRVTAPFDGTIERLAVEAGQTVERGQFLVEVTPTEAG